jgi:antitoxin (DNA-binding transcriptional repressor) of toxin-antitoxin stability system
MLRPQKDKQVRVGVRELRANLSELLRQARQGTSFLVMSRNEVIAEIRPPPGVERPRRIPGLLRARSAWQRISTCFPTTSYGPWKETEIEDPSRYPRPSLVAWG